MKVDTEQPSESMSSHGAYPPMTDVPQLGVTNIDKFMERGARSNISNIEVSPENCFKIEPCGANRCLTCEILKTDHTYTSNVTNRKYYVINPSNVTLTCKSENVVKILSLAVAAIFSMWVSPLLH